MDFESGDPSYEEMEDLFVNNEKLTVTVINDKGRRRKVLTYLASPDYVDNSLKPYDWYKDLVLAGAQEHGLPVDYIAERIQSVEGIEDPDTVRAKTQRALLTKPGN